MFGLIESPLVKCYILDGPSFNAFQCIECITMFFNAYQCSSKHINVFQWKRFMNYNQTMLQRYLTVNSPKANKERTFHAHLLMESLSIIAQKYM